MIIHCLSCGKSVSSNSFKCPYCLCEINGMTLEKNGVVMEESRLKERLKSLVLTFANK